MSEKNPPRGGTGGTNDGGVIREAIFHTPERLTTPEESRVYYTIHGALCELKDIRALTVRRPDGSHYLETGDGKKHIITTINGVAVHIEFVADGWSV